MRGYSHFIDAIANQKAEIASDALERRAIDCGWLRSSAASSTLAGKLTIRGSRGRPN